MIVKDDARVIDNLNFALRALGAARGTGNARTHNWVRRYGTREAFAGAQSIAVVSDRVCPSAMISALVSVFDGRFGPASLGRQRRARPKKITGSVRQFTVAAETRGYYE